jgi:SAM-dependent methyltransferase
LTRLPPQRTPGLGVIWDEVEHGSYAADLGLWEELATHGSAVLDVGCGSGRVALHLARAGHDVWALDHDPELVAALTARAADEGLAVRSVVGDARELSLKASFGLIVAPMQLVQLLGGKAGRMGFLRAAAAHLRPGGVIAAALVQADATPEANPAAPPTPDVTERDGWVYSSQPVAVWVERSSLVIERLRQTVSPDGELDDEPHTTRLDLVSPDRLENEARAVGLAPLGRRWVPPTPDHIGSTVVLATRGDHGLSRPPEAAR